MKNIFLFLFLSIATCITAQTYPLRTYSDIPANAYLKDTNNELPEYEGTWTGTWDNKTIFVTFKKVKSYLTHLKNNPYYNDVLKGKFKVVDNSGNILFDNLNVSDENAKIKGGRFFSNPNRYMLIYIDSDLCSATGNIYINFTDPTKTKINWKFNEDSNMITSDCQYYNTVPFPTALPKEIILTKQ